MATPPGARTGAGAVGAGAPFCFFGCVLSWGRLLGMTRARKVGVVAMAAAPMRVARPMYWLSVPCQSGFDSTWTFTTGMAAASRTARQRVRLRNR